MNNNKRAPLQNKFGNAKVFAQVDKHGRNDLLLQHIKITGNIYEI